MEFGADFGGGGAVDSGGTSVGSGTSPLCGPVESVFSDDVGAADDVIDGNLVKVTPALTSCVELKVLLERVVTVVKERIGCSSALLVEDSD